MIELNNITKTYRNGPIVFEALKGISFTIRDGEFVAIMGPSGSGKSTLMHVIGALDSPSSGQYLFDGKDIASFSESELAAIRQEKIGFVFQAFNLLPRATVLRNVMLPLIYAGVASRKREHIARQALQSVGLDEEHFYHLSNQLSGGQMQRVAIARALANNPRIILADEPTGNLDTQTGLTVLKTFKQLNKQGHTIVIITHEHEVAAHAQRTIQIKDGLLTNGRTP